MSDFPFPDRLRDHAIASLVPFFLESPDGDVAKARLAAKGILEDYQAATPRELQLAAQIVALAWASLACLRTAMAAKNLSIEEVLDLQDSAIALDRTCQKATKALEARRKERTTNRRALNLENTRWDEGAFQLAINQALDKLTDANARLASYMDSLAAPANKPKLHFLFAEQMTPAALARRARR